MNEMLERNYKCILKNDRYYIQYEYYSILHGEFKTTLFTSEIDRGLLSFDKDHRQIAEDFANARQEIIDL